MPARARVVPLAVLIAVLVALALGRSRRTVGTTRAAARSDAVPTPSTDGGASGLAAEAVADATVAPRAGRMVHEDGRHTHRAPGHAPRHATLAWRIATDGPIEAQVATSPDEQTLYAATLGGSVWALTRAGVKRWTATLGGRSYASPAVSDDGTIYVGSDGGNFYALTPSGQVRWKIETRADADTGAALLPEGGVVFAAGNVVYAVDAAGDVLWRFAAKGKVFTAPALTSDGLIVFGSQDDHAYALDSKGGLAWATDLGDDVDGAPAIGDDGAIFVGTDHDEVVRLGPRGEIVWRADVGGYVRGTLSVARNGDVLAGVYGPTPRQVRVTSAGTVRGAFAVQGTGAKEFGVHGGALEDDDGTLVFGAQDDRVHAVGADGNERWSFLTGGDVDAPALLLADGLLVVGSDDGFLYALGDAAGSVARVGAIE